MKEFIANWERMKKEGALIEKKAQASDGEEGTLYTRKKK